MSARRRTYLVHADGILFKGGGEDEGLDDGVGSCVCFRAFVDSSCGETSSIAFGSECW